jgi:hypothetical protein
MAAFTPQDRSIVRATVGAEQACRFDDRRRAVAAFDPEVAKQPGFTNSEPRT